FLPGLGGRKIRPGQGGSKGRQRQSAEGLKPLKKPAKSQGSVQRAAIAQESHRPDKKKESRERPDVRPNFRRSVPLQENAAHDSQEVRVGQRLAEVLRQMRHAPEREQESRQ